MSAPQYPYPQQPVPPPKKGTPIWIWLAAGFAFLVLLMIAGLAVTMYWFSNKVKDAAGNPVAAIVKMAAAANPDVEIVSSDDSSGNVTIRDKRTGKVVTIGAESIKDGKLVLETDEGKAVIGGGADVKAPAWVPMPPAAQVVGGMTANSEGQAAGTVVFTSEMSVAELKAFFTEKAKAGGFEEKGTVTATGGGDEGAHMTFQNEARKRNLVISIGKSPAGTGGNIAYSEKP